MLVEFVLTKWETFHKLCPEMWKWSSCGCSGVRQEPLLCLRFTCRALGLKWGAVFNMYLLQYLNVCCLLWVFWVVLKFCDIQNTRKASSVKITLGLSWNIILNLIQKILSILECLHGVRNTPIIILCKMSIKCLSFYSVRILILK